MITNIKDAVWQRKHPKKKDTLQSFGKKTKTTRIFLILIETWVMNWLLSSSTTVIAVYLLFPKRLAISKKILSTKDCTGKTAMRFYPSWCTNLNKTARATQKWQMDYFQKVELEE
ncbi:MepB family protein [Streptococcus cristatus]|uniref:MepB family protein n=1 Tax=Streptococcus cristatus TaxID=45634 RepID=UPI0035B652C6